MQTDSKSFGVKWHVRNVNEVRDENADDDDDVDNDGSQLEKLETIKEELSSCGAC